MQSEFKHLIKIACVALEAEDRFLLGAMAANQAAYPREKRGVLRIFNERYYQFVVARSLASSYPFAAAVEIESHDLVLHYPGNPSQWFAVVEMKCWRSVKGEQEIRSIQQDINDKLRPAKAEHALMLLFSANPHGQTEQNLGWLAKQLSITSNEDHSVWEVCWFPTQYTQGEKVDFWVAGYEVK
jgi:hypothetical protein